MIGLKDNEHGNGRSFKKAPKFVFNKRGELIHIPIRVSEHKTFKGKHLSVKYHCGNVCNGTKIFEFYNRVPAGKDVCVKCLERFNKWNS